MRRAPRSIGIIKKAAAIWSLCARRSRFGTAEASSGAGPRDGAHFAGAAAQTSPAKETGGASPGFDRAGAKAKACAASAEDALTRRGRSVEPGCPSRLEAVCSASGGYGPGTGRVEKVEFWPGFGCLTNSQYGVPKVVSSGPGTGPAPSCPDRLIRFSADPCASRLSPCCHS
jgi:hypothetical protein